MDQIIQEIEDYWQPKRPLFGEIGMSNEQDDKLNKLLGRQVSIAERTRIAKDLDNERLQIAAPYSPQAKEELKRRRHEERLLASREPFIAYARLSPRVSKNTVFGLNFLPGFWTRKYRL
jgi:hypothetical protein